MTVTRGNPLQIVQKQQISEKIYDNACGNKFKLW